MIRMRKWLICVAALVAGSAFDGCARDASQAEPAEAEVVEERHPDLDKLLGSWQIVSSEEMGEPFPDPVGNLYTFLGQGKVKIWTRDLGEVTIDFSIDPAHDPKHIDFELGRPPETHPGIYSIDGGTLQICFYGPIRPKDFKTSPEDTWRYHVLQRVKSN